MIKQIGDKMADFKDFDIKLGKDAGRQKTWITHMEQLRAGAGL